MIRGSNGMHSAGGCCHGPRRVAACGVWLATAPRCADRCATVHCGDWPHDAPATARPTQRRASLNGAHSASDDETEDRSLT